MNNNKLIISHSSIQVFHSCKRRFKYKYIDRVQTQEQISNKYLSFGQSLHTTLAKFNRIKCSKYRTLENLHELLRKSWIRKGYESRDEERDFGLRALEMLKNYYYNPLDQGKENLLIEEMIYLDIDGKFTLCGKLDKSYLRNDNAIETIDYKTGKNIGSIDCLQMPIYLMLTMTKLGCFPDVVSYYYLSHNQKVSQEVTEDYINDSLDFLREVSDKIITEKKYSCTPSIYCYDNCEYFHSCHEAKGSSLLYNRSYKN